MNEYIWLNKIAEEEIFVYTFSLANRLRDESLIRQIYKDKSNRLNIGCFYAIIIMLYVLQHFEKVIVFQRCEPLNDYEEEFVKEYLSFLTAPA